MFTLSSQDEAMLHRVHPDLVRVVRLAAQLAKQPFRVAEGVRSVSRAASLAEKGTGISNSLHILQPDGFSHAVDLWPIPTDWKNIRSFERVADSMYEAADRLGVLIQWGADWNANGINAEKGEWDYPHFQIARPWREADARKAAERRRETRAAKSAGATPPNSPNTPEKKN